MTAAETGRPVDLATVATAAAGAAEVCDKRTITGRRFLIGAMERAMKGAHVHPSVEEAVAAVNRFYEQKESGESIDGEGFLATLRRLRLQVVRDQETVAAGEMTGREAAAWAEDKAIIRAWPCPTCEALPDVQCRNLRTGKPAGAWFPGHPARIVLATRAAG